MEVPKSVSAETTIRLASSFQNIVAVKEASGNLGQVMKILKDKPPSFEVISGDDHLTLPMIAAGASGVISVVANVFPKEFSGMVRYCLDGDFSAARKLHYRVFDITNLLFDEGSPAGAKAALHAMGLCKNILRLPLVPVSADLALKISVEVKSISAQGK